MQSFEFKVDGRNILEDVLQEFQGTPVGQAQNGRNSRMCPKIQKKSLTGLNIGRDTRTLLENSKTEERAARGDRRGQARKIRERNKKIKNFKKEKI